jgi:hypothetical protein
MDSRMIYITLLLHQRFTAIGLPVPRRKSPGKLRQGKKLHLAGLFFWFGPDVPNKRAGSQDHSSF